MKKNRFTILAVILAVVPAVITVIADCLLLAAFTETGQSDYLNAAGMVTGLCAFSIIPIITILRDHIIEERNL